MKVLVIGAAGFVGSHTVDLLLRAGHEIVGLDNFRSGRPELLAGALASPRFVHHVADALAPGVLDGIVACVRPHAIIHLAALVGVQESLSEPELNFSLNVRLPWLVAEAMRVHRIPRLVFASSAAVYGACPDAPIAEGSPTAPLSPYGAAKLAAEHILLGQARAVGFSAICLRYFNAYGPRQHPASPYSGVISIFADRASRGLPLTIHGDGAQTRDFVHVSDLARANVLAATQADPLSASYNICTGRPTSLTRLADLIGTRSDLPQLVRYAPLRPADIRHSCGDPTAARRELGFETEITVEQGLASLLKEQPLVPPLPAGWRREEALLAGS